MKRYRPNVAAILRRPDGKILLCQRADYPDSWQFPQGGIDRGEDPGEALAREVREETGLPREAYRVSARSGPHRYDLPPAARKKNFDGQEQTYFLCDLREAEPVIDLTAGPHREFLSARWVEPAGLRLAEVPAMKREVYRRVLRELLGLCD